MKLKDWCSEVPGRQTALAKHLGKSPSVVSQAVNGSIPVPAAWVRGIVELTAGAVGYEDLLPEPTK